MYVFHCSCPESVFLQYKKRLLKTIKVKISGESMNLAHHQSQKFSGQMTSENQLEGRKILIIEDDPDIAELIRIHLKDRFKEVQVANDGSVGYELASKNSWDLIILDLRLPHKDGLQLCRELRFQGNYVPILMLTSKSSEYDRVIGLESGADDYVTKPFSVMELTARVRAIFRRAQIIEAEEAKGETIKQASNKLSSPDKSIELDIRNYKVLKDGQSIDLTVKEFDLLTYFLQNPGSVFSRAHLLSRIWGYGHEGYEHTVNSHINRLRAKIETDPTRPKLITTIWGVGYKLV